MQAHPRQKIFLPPKRSGRNHKTPERTTIEKPLYFCSRSFVGQFASVLGIAVGSGAASERLCLFLCSIAHADHTPVTRDTTQQDMPQHDDEARIEQP
jgi:hypothetical protein